MTGHNERTEMPTEVLMAAGAVWFSAVAALVAVLAFSRSVRDRARRSHASEVRRIEEVVWRHAWGNEAEPTFPTDRPSRH